MRWLPHSGFGQEGSGKVSVEMRQYSSWTPALLLIGKLTPQQLQRAEGIPLP